jgi:hypothetical protein
MNLNNSIINIIQTQSIDESTQATITTAAQRRAIIQGIQDYLEGKTDKLPAHNENNLGINVTGPVMVPLGLKEAMALGNSSSGSMAPMISLPDESHLSTWANRYVFCGGSSPYQPAWTIDGMMYFNGLVSNSPDEFVMHQNGNLDENCIQGIRYGNTVGFRFWTQFGASGYYPYYPANWSQPITYPVNDEFFLFVRPHMIDNSHYNSVEYCVWDLDTNQATDLIVPFASGKIGDIHTVDVTLEYSNPPSYPSVSWNHADQVHAYIRDGSMMDWSKQGHTYTLYTSSCYMASYVDGIDSNTVASIWLTRYSPLSGYPPHP